MIMCVFVCVCVCVCVFVCMCVCVCVCVCATVCLNVAAVVRITNPNVYVYYTTMHVCSQGETNTFILFPIGHRRVEGTKPDGDVARLLSDLNAAM